MFYKDIAKDDETRFGISNYELERQKSYWFNKGRIRWKYHERIYWIKSKHLCYLINDHGEDREAKCPKTCVIKRKLIFEDYKICLKATRLENKVNHLEKNKLI